MNTVRSTYSLLLTSSLLMKSFPSSETPAKASSSNSQSQAFTFFNVSTSFSPAKGDSPLKLGTLININKQKKEWHSVGVVALGKRNSTETMRALCVGYHCVCKKYGNTEVLRTDSHTYWSHNHVPDRQPSTLL